MSSLFLIAAWDGGPVSRWPWTNAIKAVGYRGSDRISETVLDEGRVGLSLSFRRTSGSQAGRIAFCPTGNLAVAADASLYNCADLADRLGIENTGDAAVIGAAYARWGEQALDHLDGDFAFVIWDGDRKRVFAARDPFGIRQLHFWTDSRALVIASEAKQIIAAGLAEPEPDMAALASFLADDYNVIDRSFFAGIARLPAGHYLIGQAGAATSHRYWQPSPCVDRSANPVGKFRELLSSAVEKRLESSSPICLELSGGLDSNSIVALAANRESNSGFTDPSPHTVSYTYDGLPADESPFIEAAVSLHRLPWHGVKLTAEGWSKSATEVMWRNDSPFADPQIPMRGACESHMAGLNARVVLSGLGGDEVLYDAGCLKDLATPGSILHLFREAKDVRQLAHAMLPAPMKKLIRHFRPAHESPKIPWLNALAYTRLTPAPPDLLSRTNLQRGMWRYIALNSRLSSIAIYQTGSASDQSFEYRFPFLDKDLFEFLYRLPLGQRLPRRISKRIMREALRDIMPPKVVERPGKTFFASYYTLVLKSSWKDVCWVFDDLGRVGELVHEKEVVDLINEWQSQPDPPWVMTYEVWRLICAILWVHNLGRYTKTLP